MAAEADNAFGFFGDCFMEENLVARDFEGGFEVFFCGFAGDCSELEIASNDEGCRFSFSSSEDRTTSCVVDVALVAFRVDFRFLSA